MDDFKEEKEYLEQVTLNIEDKIENTTITTERLRKEVENIGVPNWDERKYFQNCKNKIYQSGKILKDLNDSKNNPYFGRMDLKIIEEDNIENLMMYIGEKSILNNEKKNLVYDWRSPVANLYYMNNQDDFSYGDTKFELNLKRQIEIDKAVLINIYNSYKRGSDLNVQDTFLQKVLESKKSRNEFTDIIRTIQSNQNSIIRDDLFTNSIVQGVAGSGKTVVLLHRLSYLLYNYKDMNKNKLIFITPSRIFQSKLANINRSLSLTTLKMLPMEEYYLEKIKLYIPSFKINMITKDDENENILKFIYSNDYLNYLDNILNNYFKEYAVLVKTSNKLIFDKNKILSSLVSNDNMLKKILANYDYKTLDEKEKLLELQTITKKYLKKDNLKKILDIIHHDLIRKYNINDKEYIKKNKCNKCYAYSILWLYMKYGFTTYNDYKYMFIDEMQDYSDNEFRLIAKMERNPHLNLYGDINQDILKYIDKKSIIGLNNLVKEILSTDDVLNYKLEENYRNSKQITNYCNEFLSNKMISMGINSDEVNIININKKEVYNNILKISNNKDIVIITKDSDLEEKLRSNNYEVYSVKTAKGLEFSKVLVIEEDFNLTEKYVAYTRTLDKLFIYKINE